MIIVLINNEFLQLKDNKLGIIVDTKLMPNANIALTTNCWYKLGSGTIRTNIKVRDVNTIPVKNEYLTFILIICDVEWIRFAIAFEQRTNT